MSLLVRILGIFIAIVFLAITFTINFQPQIPGCQFVPVLLNSNNIEKVVTLDNIELSDLLWDYDGVVYYYNLGPPYFDIPERLIKFAYPSCTPLQTKNNSLANVIFAVHSHPGGNFLRYPYIAFTGENSDAAVSGEYPPIVRFQPNCKGLGRRCIPHPYMVNTMKPLYPELLRTYVENHDIIRVPNVKKKFLLAYCSSNCVGYRNNFFNLVLKYDNTNTTHGLCGCGSNNPHKGRLKSDWGTTGLNYAEYKFAIAMENSLNPAYATEKLLNAIKGNTIPIYRGADLLIKNQFNPERIIFYGDFLTPEECARHVVALGRNEEEYNRLLNLPIFREKGKIAPMLDFNVSSGRNKYFLYAAYLMQNPDNGTVPIIHPSKLIPRHR